MFDTAANACSSLMDGDRQGGTATLLAGLAKTDMQTVLA